MRLESYNLESQKRDAEQAAVDAEMKARTEAELAAQADRRRVSDISHSQLECTKRHIDRELERQAVAKKEQESRK